MEPDNRTIAEKSFAMTDSFTRKLEPASRRTAQRTGVVGDPNRINRGRSFGDEQWAERIAEKHGIWFSLRIVGRPRENLAPVK